MDCDQIRELLEAYALGALDENERATVEGHIAGCPDCQRLANKYADIVNMLPQALASASPMSLPSSLKNRLLQSLEASPERSHSPNEKGGGVWHRMSIWLWPSWWRPRPFGALAAVILLALSLTWSIRLSVTLARERLLRAELASLVSQQEVVLEVVDSSKTIKRVLRSPGSGSPSYGKLYTRPDLPHVVAMAARLPQPPEGQSYHLWLRSQGQIQLAGVMTVNSQGFGLLIFDADHNGPVYEAAQLTLQSEGSTTPSGVSVILWEAPR